MRFLSFMLLCTLCSLFGSTYSFAQSNDPLVLQDAYELVGAYDAWDITTGSKEVIVAVIDNGFDNFHPDLAGNTWKNVGEIPYNGIDDDNNGYIDDYYGWSFVPDDINNDGYIDEAEEKGNNNPRPSVDSSEYAFGEERVIGHGTSVAGIIGGVGYNGKFGSGINWNVSLMNIKIVASSGEGTLVAFDDAIRYAVDNGATIISASIVGTVDSVAAVRNALEYAYQHDVVVVAAAGNNRKDLAEDPLYPICIDAGASNQLVIGVSAIENDRSFASFSNYGGDCIDITAPGVDIASVTRYSKDIPAFAEKYRTDLRGTSFGTPLVSGAAALIRGMYPSLTANQVTESLLQSTKKTPAKDEELYTDLFGAGLLNIPAALEYAKELAEDVTPFTLASAGPTTPIGGEYRAEVVDEGVLLYRKGVMFRHIPVPTASAVIDGSHRQVALLTKDLSTLKTYSFFGTVLTETVLPTTFTPNAVSFGTDSLLYVYGTSGESIVVQPILDGALLPAFTAVDSGVLLTSYDNGAHLGTNGQQYIRYAADLTHRTVLSPGRDDFGPATSVTVSGEYIVTEHEAVTAWWNTNNTLISLFLQTS